MGAFSRAAAKWSAGGYGALVSIPAVHPGLLAVVSPDSQPGGLKELLTHLPDVSCCVIFTRDSSSGRVEIDNDGWPVIKYWPCDQTLEHLLDVSWGGGKATAHERWCVLVTDAAVVQKLCSRSVAGLLQEQSVLLLLAPWPAFP